MDLAADTQGQTQQEPDDEQAGHADEGGDAVGGHVGEQGAELGALVVLLGQGQQHAEVSKGGGDRIGAGIANPVSHL